MPLEAVFSLFINAGMGLVALVLVRDVIRAL
jgi:hypothetical protein